MRNLFFTFIILFLVSCSPKKDTVVVTLPVVQTCSVGSDADGNGVINCPDGSVVTVPPNVIIQTVTQTVEVIVQVPKDCKKSDPNPGHGNDNQHGHSKAR